jgi:hypothetical protein
MTAPDEPSRALTSYQGPKLATDAASIQAALDDMFDCPVLRHGFTDYSRDYEVVWQGIGPRTGKQYVTTFRACVEAHCTVDLSPEMFPLDDVFIDFERWEAAGAPDGYVWGVKWANNYPGATYVNDSERAARWSALLNVPMHEVIFQTNPFTLTLVFHELQVTLADDSQDHDGST